MAECPFRVGDIVEFERSKKGTLIWPRYSLMTGFDTGGSGVWHKARVTREAIRTDNKFAILPLDRPDYPFWVKNDPAFFRLPGFLRHVEEPSRSPVVLELEQRAKEDAKIEKLFDRLSEVIYGTPLHQVRGGKARVLSMAASMIEHDLSQV